MKNPNIQIDSSEINSLANDVLHGELRDAAQMREDCAQNGFWQGGEVE